MKINNNIPAYRFQGYTDAWELRKLGEVAEIITGTTPSTFDEENYGGKRLFVSPVDIQDNRYITETLTTLTEKGHLLGRELRPGATLFVSIGSTIGKVAQLKDFATSNQQINAVISGDKIDDDFIFTGLEKKSAQIKNLSSQQAVPIINKSTFSNIEFEFPTLPEQKAIGTFFSTLDRHITLHQRKLDTLKEQKKSYLKLLFPAKGQTKPALRFQGFEDDWKEVKVSDIFQVTRGQVLSTNLVSDTKSDEYPYPVYSSQTKNNGLMGFYKDYLFDTAITWTTDGANAGTVRFREGKFYSTNVNGVLLSDEGYSNIAISEILNTVAWKYVSKVGNPKLMNNIMSEIILLIPGGFAEQEVLSSFFQTLDQEMAQVEDKLTSLKEMKKTLLRKLFV